MAHQCSLRYNTAPDYATSSGQFFLFNSESENDAVKQYYILEADRSVGANEKRTVPKSISLHYGDISYPSDGPLELTSKTSNRFNSTPLYYEYLKALGKVGDRLTGNPMSKRLFEKTMPIILLKPFANDAVKLSDAKDILLRMTSSGVLPNLDVDKNIWIVVFTLSSFRILPDGSVQSAGLK
jgi:hypothetical protein